MILGVEIKPLKENSDERGWLMEIFRSDQTEFKPAMSYISQTLSGVIRGPHEHLKQSDFFVFFTGQFKLFLWDNRTGAKNYRQLEIYEVGQDNPCSVLVPPGVVHAYKCISADPGLIINLPDELYQGENRLGEIDEVRWEAMADSPFSVE